MKREVGQSLSELGLVAAVVAIAVLALGVQIAEAVMATPECAWRPALVGARFGPPVHRNVSSLDRSRVKPASKTMA